MSDRIRVNTDEMMGFVKDLQRLGDKLNDNASSLRRADFTNCGGGGTVSPQQIRLRCSGATITGSRAPTLVRSFASGMDATGSYIDTLASHVQVALRRFEETENRIVAIGEGDTSETLEMSVPKPKYSSINEVQDENRKNWEAKNSFIDTTYDKKIKEELKKQLLTNPAFDEKGWRACTTVEERQKYLRKAMDVINAAMGTKLTRNLYLTDETGTATVRVWLDDSTTVEVELPDTAGGGYYRQWDCIVLRYNENDSFAEIVGTLCHENRHNLQQEMRSTKDLANSKYVVSPEEYQAVADEVKDWSEAYFSYDNATVKAETERRYKELPWYDKIMITQQYSNKDKLYKTVWYENYEKYAMQANEVDARYMEEYAEKLMVMRQMQELWHLSPQRAYGSGDRAW